MQQRQSGKPHFAARIAAEILNFPKIRKSKAENQGPPEASGVWLWFVFGYFRCLWALSLQANMGKGLLQILVLLQQPRRRSDRGAGLLQCSRLIWDMYKPTMIVLTEEKHVSKWLETNRHFMRFS